MFSHPKIPSKGTVKRKVVKLKANNKREETNVEEKLERHVLKFKDSERYGR